MKNQIKKVYFIISFMLIMTFNAYSMGLRSFVALPIEKGGTVVRFSHEHAKDSNTNNLITSVAYGLSSYQTLLLGLPYSFSSSESNRLGDVSALYRHIVWQKDSLAGTKRLGLLSGAVIPSHNKRDAAAQVGFVYTYFKNKDEIDIDILYQKALHNRLNRARYDISWQHRLFPINRPIWGFSTEVNSVLELNGRYKEGNEITHQITAALQLINQKWVFESGIAKDINNDKELIYIISARFHF